MIGDRQFIPRHGFVCVHWCVLCLGVLTVDAQHLVHPTLVVYQPVFRALNGARFSPPTVLLELKS